MGTSAYQACILQVIEREIGIASAVLPFQELLTESVESQRWRVRHRLATRARCAEHDHVRWRYFNSLFAGIGQTREWPSTEKYVEAIGS
jgi:hypothetical protein